MTKQATCPNGHTYIQVNVRYWPQGAPKCPACFKEWIEKHRETHKDMDSVFCPECEERIKF